MQIFGIVLCVLAIEGLLIKHIAFILLHGSIFESMRWGFNRRMREGRGIKRWFFQKLSELFSCNLCMVAQVSLWFHALLFILTRSFYWKHIVTFTTFLDIAQLSSNIIVMFILWFCWSIVMAAAGMFIWELTGIPVDFMQVNERHKKEIENIETRRIASKNGWQPSKIKDLPITFLDFFYMITVIEYDTTGIGCRGLKGIVRGEEIDEICQQWAHDRKIAWEQIKMDVLPLVQIAAKNYFAGLKHVPKSRMHHMHESWNKAQEKYFMSEKPASKGKEEMNATT